MQFPWPAHLASQPGGFVYSKSTDVVSPLRAPALFS